jgi:outer membrane protein TolC
VSQWEVIAFLFCKVKLVKNASSLLAIFVLLQFGCRSPQVILRTQHCDRCFTNVGHEPEALSNATVSETGSIEEYVQLGLALNPRIQEAEHRIEAIRHRVPQVLSLPDPMVNTTTFLAPVQTAAGKQAFALGVSQKITNAERRATNAAILSDEVAAAEANLQGIKLETAQQIRTACYQLLFIRKSIEITSEDAGSLQLISEDIVRQHEVKRTVTQQDVLNVYVEQSKIENQLTELRQKEKTYQARLSRLVHVDPRSQLAILDELHSANNQLDVDSLMAQAAQSRPDLQVQLATIRSDRKKTRLASLQQIPDFTVGLNWIGTSSDGISPVANGDDALLLSIGFNLPIYQGRIRAEVCEAQADIIPKSKRALDLSIDEYSTGKSDYVQLIANWRIVLRYRIAEANLQSQYQQLLASLAQKVGQLDSIQINLPN